MSEDMLKLYRERLAEGERRFQKKYDAIAASRQSYKQFIPDEALDVESSAGYSWVGEDGEEEIPANTSQYHYPIHRAISRTMIENLTANSPRYEVESNDITGSIAKKHMEQEFKKVLAKENIKLKLLDLLRRSTWSRSSRRFLPRRILNLNRTSHTSTQRKELLCLKQQQKC